MAQDLNMRVLELLVSGFTAPEIATRLRKPLPNIEQIISINGWTSEQSIRKAWASLASSGGSSTTTQTQGVEAQVGGITFNSVSPSNRHVFAYSGATGKYKNRALEAADIQSGEFANGRISEASVTQHQASINHDALSNYAANQHRVWEASIAENIHADNITEASVVQHQSALVITESQISDLGNYMPKSGGQFTGDIGIYEAPTSPVSINARLNAVSYQNGFRVNTNGGTDVRAALTASDADLGRLLLYNSSTNLRVLLSAGELSYVLDGLAVGATAFSGSEKFRMVGDSRFEGTGVFTGLLTAASSGDGAEAFRLDIERAWSFYQKDTGSITSLVLRPAVDGKSFYIQNQDGSTFVNFRTANAGSGSVSFTTDINVSGNTVWHAGNLSSPVSTSDAPHWTGVHIFENTVFVDNGQFFALRETNDAYQRVDARVDDTDKARLHWYGITSAGATSNFRHAYYDGSSYIDITASSGKLFITGGADFSSTVAMDGIEVHGVVSGETYFQAGDGSPGNIIFAITRGSSNNVEFTTFGNDDYVFDGRLVTSRDILSESTSASGTRVFTIKNADRSYSMVVDGALSYSGTNDAFHLHDETNDYSILKFSHTGTSANVSLQAAYDATTGSAANVQVNSAGFLKRSTSSLRYKDEVYTLDDAFFSSRKAYSSDSISEALSKFRPIHSKHKGDGKYYIGFAAEEVHDIMPELVGYDDQLRPDWVQYPHLTALLVGGWQRHEARLSALQKEMISKYQENQDLIYATRRELMDKIKDQETRISELEGLVSP